MDNKKLTPTKLVLPVMFAFAGLFGCSQDNELAEPSSQLSQSATSAVTGATNSKISFRSKHYIVLSTGEKLPAGLANNLAAANGQVTSLMTEAGVATVYSDDPAFAAKAGKIAGVRSVVRDLNIQWFNPEDEKIITLEDFGTPPASGDNDRYFDLQWGHAAIKASEAWNTGVRGEGVRVAVLDSGFDLDHPDLAPNIDMAASKNFVVGEQLGYALPGVGSHGSHTAGTIAAADNGIGIIGVAPQAKLILVKVLRDSGSGAFSWIMDGIIHATNQGADVINMSIGAALPRNGKFLDDNGTPDDPSDDFIVSDTKATQELLVALSRVTSYATKNGVTVIASAGNEANDGNVDKSLVHLPSGSTGVISISATAPRGWALNPYSTFMDHLASYSNYGTSDVHFAAPGGDYQYPGNEIVTIGGVRQYAYVFDYVFSAGSNLAPGTASYYWSVGTSMAAPHATGVAALIISKNGGSMNPAQVLAKLRESADDLGKPGRDPQYGYGRVNAFRAVTN
ncbi:S8 family peptidase [Pontibacter arcticus]|uniref:Peptidase S8 and S53 subtilisin kexin sedolisin n=1 Tax=Pontibacter arcticus TaxID=2080288 RepID=A0A364RES2_9BACT|nr:S8 family serine peptidase [Pontibacter arcticus]RAU82772.1 peptidase S8 and S53 subtilisin kexin sedolisin [Pontibacter arcticus]